MIYERGLLNKINEVSYLKKKSPAWPSWAFLLNYHALGLLIEQCSAFLISKTKKDFIDLKSFPIQT